MITLHFFLSLVATAFMVAVVATVYIGLQDQPILNWWFRFGYKYKDKWFYKPIWGCERCIAGQMALWGFLGYVLAGSVPYDPLHHLFLISASIVFVAYVYGFLNTGGKRIF